MTILHVKPVEGRAVLDPRTRAPLPPAGRRVEVDAYWRRRLADGDIVIVPNGVPAGAPAEDAPAVVPQAEPPAKPAPRTSKKGTSS